MLMRLRGKVNADRRFAQLDKLIDPARAKAAGAVDEAGIGIELQPFAVDDASALRGVDIAMFEHLERLDALALEDHRSVIAFARHIDAENLRCIADLVIAIVPLERFLDFGWAYQRIDRRRRKLAEDVDQDVRIVAAPFVDLLLRMLDRYARRPVRVLRIGRNLDDLPHLAMGVRVIKRPLPIERVAGLHHMRLDRLAGEDRFNRR